MPEISYLRRRKEGRKDGRREGGKEGMKEERKKKEREREGTKSKNWMEDYPPRKQNFRRPCRKLEEEEEEVKFGPGNNKQCRLSNVLIITLNETNIHESISNSQPDVHFKKTFPAVK